MSYFQHIHQREHEAVLFCSDPKTGLKGFIAIHNTTLGPSLGGCRIKPYKSEEDALLDVLRLSRAMTYKSSMAGLNLGGGKSVIMMDDPSQKTPELLTEFAERINLLKGNYISAGDIGSNMDDLSHMRKTTPWVVGLPEGAGGLGDSSILTALGVFKGIEAAVNHHLERADLQGIRVAVQGTGKVGYNLIKLLLEAGCSVVASDTNQGSLDMVRRDFPSVTLCTPEELYTHEVDVFSPNAIGGLITEAVARDFKAKILAGGANNPLGGESVAQILQDRNILYAPDFLINAGGIIMVASEMEEVGFDEAQRRTEKIYDRTLEVLRFAKENSMLPWGAARHLALERIKEAKTSGGGPANRTPALV